MYTRGLTQSSTEHAGDSTDHPADAGAAPGCVAAALTVVVERSPSALARVYSVLCLMNLVPESFRGTQAGEDAVCIDLVFKLEPEKRIDLLIRKLAQLTECLEVTETSAMSTQRSRCDADTPVFGSATVPPAIQSCRER